jgi:hypothetical protein
MVALSMCAGGKRHQSRSVEREIHCLFTTPACFILKDLTMKKFLTRIGRFAENPYLQAVVAAVLIITSLREAWETLAEDFSSGSMRASHGTLLLGVTSFLQSLPEIVKDLDAVGKVVEEEVVAEVRKVENPSE